MSNPETQEIQDKLGACSDDIATWEEFNAKAAVDNLLEMIRSYVEEHSSDTIDSNARHDSRRDTPGVETFFWATWERVFRDLGKWEINNVDRAVEFVKEVLSRPKGENVWTIWGADVDFTSLPLLGPSIREANNGPFYYTGPSDSEMSRPEVQNALAGAGTGGSTDEAVLLALKRRDEWLGLQAFVAKLLGEVGLESYAMHGVWAARDGLEDWPEEPPTIITEVVAGQPPQGEDTAAYRALMVEGAAMWLHFAAPQLYACTEIWGPNGNPEWKRNEGAPGRGGALWNGVDGMDKEKKRWELWKDVFGRVIAWYDKEVSAGRGNGWTVKEAAVKALEAMNAAEAK